MNSPFSNRNKLLVGRKKNRRIRKKRKAYAEHRERERETHACTHACTNWNLNPSGTNGARPRLPTPITHRRLREISWPLLRNPEVCNPDQECMFKTEAGLLWAPQLQGGASLGI